MSEVKFKIGDKVKKVNGPFAPFIGVVNLIESYGVAGKVTDPLTGGYSVGSTFGDSLVHFELVKENNMFKVGDKVQCVKPYMSYIVGKTYEVMEFENRGDVYGWNYVNGEKGEQQIVNMLQEYFELVEERKSDLEQLIKKANEGFGAARTIRDLYASNVEVLFDDDSIYYHNDWHKVAKIPEWTIRPRTKFISFTVGNNWLVKLEGDNVHVGCQQFNALELKSKLKQLNCGSTIEIIQKTIHTLNSSRKGVIYLNNSISWQDSERIVAALEAAGVK